MLLHKILGFWDKTLPIQHANLYPRCAVVSIFHPNCKISLEAASDYTIFFHFDAQLYVNAFHFTFYMIIVISFIFTLLPVSVSLKASWVFL